MSIGMAIQGFWWGFWKAAGWLGFWLVISPIWLPIVLAVIQARKKHS